MRGIMFVSSLDSRGDCAGRGNKLSFPYPLPTHGDYNSFHDNQHGLTVSARFVERDSGSPSTSLRSVSGHTIASFLETEKRKELLFGRLKKIT